MKLLAFLFMALPSFAFAIEDTKVWFGYFLKGDGARGTKEEMQKMQEGHMANLQRLFKEGKMPMAGPLQDPTTVRRGIIVMLAPSREGLESYFQNDPYVKNRIMGVEFHEWNVALDALPKEYPDPNAIEPNRLVLLKAKPGKTIPEYLMKQHAEALKEQVKPSLYGTLAGTGFSEVLMFHGENDGDVKARIARDPLVRLGWVEVEQMPLWMAKGALKATK